jgi:large subunit ribosomal protein L7Ae
VNEVTNSVNSKFKIHIWRNKMVGTEVAQELIEETYRAIETARATGKISKGSNETTKALERGNAKLVAIAKDTDPIEVVLHLPALSKEKGVVCIEVPSKEELGAAAGLHVKTACVAITKEGEAKKILNSLVSQLGAPAKKEKAEAPAEVAEEKTEEPVEETPEAPAEETPIETKAE